MSMINHKNKTFSDEVVKEMLSQPVRLAKAVCEYEEIAHNLEKELNNMLENKNTYKAMYQDLLERFNSLIDEYNELVDAYNNLI